MNKYKKATIVLLHGTWAEPSSSEQLRWYQPGRQFAVKLDAALKQLGVSATCWAHIDEGKHLFQWSGKNSWIDRAIGASALASYIDKLQKEGWIVHLIAHSHGGNVALEALPKIRTSMEHPNGLSGKLITLGTPFMDTSTLIEDWRLRRFGAKSIVAWSLYLIPTALSIFLTYYSIDVGNFLAIALTMALTIFLILIGIRAANQIPPQGDWKIFRSVLRAKRQTTPFMLAISSPMDEAWQVLHHIRNTSSPITPPHGFLRYMLESIHQHIKRDYEIEKAHAANDYATKHHTTKGKSAVAAANFLVNLLKMFAFCLLLTLLLDYIKLFDLDIFRKYFGDQEQNSHARVDILIMICGSWAIFFSISGILFGSTIYSLVWDPFRVVVRVFRSILAAPTFAVSYVVRRGAWRLLQDQALGTEGYKILACHWSKDCRHSFHQVTSNMRIFRKQQ